ncbi:MAG: hypothetical protein ACR2RD_00600 [Woeseiaceae bacterium]
MNSGMVDIARVIERRASVVERKISALRNEEQVRQRRIQELDRAQRVYQQRLQHDLANGRTVTIQTLDETSQDGSEFERALQAVQLRLLELHAEIDQLGKQRKSCRDMLLGLWRKAEFMREQSARQSRKKERRQFARDAAGVRPVVVK